MANTITHLMWGYQAHFRVAMETRAKDLFNKLDDRLLPEIFFVGILIDPNARNRFPSCVEPEEDFWIRSDAFESVMDRAKELLGTYPESGMLQSHPVAQQNQDDSLSRRAVRDAIQSVICGNEARPENRRFYVSLPMRVNEYWVCMVLSLRRDIVESYPFLITDTAQLHKYRSFPLPVSLIDAAVSRFLNSAEQELAKPEPCMPELTDSEDLVRAAGAELARSVAPRITDQYFGQGYNLFQHCSTISSLLYERREGSGRIVIAGEDHPAIEPVVTFVNPIKLGNHRAARKLLEMSSDDLPLHSDGERLFGLIKTASYDASKENLFEIQIVGHFHWEFLHDHLSLMTVRDGVPSLPKLPFDEMALRSDVTRIFKGIAASSTDLLLSLVKEAEQESHGTLLVISEAAAEEAERLASQGTPITPYRLTPDLLKHLTPIDGAILLDPDGTCHAIGTILDGRATPNGDPSRGARFNSAIRYVESAGKKAPCLAVVVSEDGGVDLIPNLRPAVKRSAIDDAIALLKSEREAKRLHVRPYRATLDWLDAHRFYLRKDDCDVLNELVSELEERLASESNMRIVRRPFEANSAFDEDLYYEDHSE